MHENIDVRRGRKLRECVYNGSVGQEVPIEISGLDIEDIDKDRDVGEHMLSLL